MRGLLLAIALLLLLPLAAQAAEPVVKVYAGANGVWYDGPEGLPSDYEAGLNGRASLSPHISLVGGTWYGFKNEFVRAAGGLRITVTDPAARDLSVGLGAQYQTSSDDLIRPTEWTADASIGWRPWPENKLVIGAQAGYGFDTSRASMMVALRYPLFGAF